MAQTDRKAVVVGLKHKITEDEAMTGEEFCRLVGVDYHDIVNQRLKDQKENFQYFIHELLKIPEVKQKIVKVINNE